MVNHNFRNKKEMKEKKCLTQSLIIISILKTSSKKYQMCTKTFQNNHHRPLKSSSVTLLRTNLFKVQKAPQFDLMISFKMFKQLYNPSQKNFMHSLTMKFLNFQNSSNNPRCPLELMTLFNFLKGNRKSLLMQCLNVIIKNSQIRFKNAKIILMKSIQISLGFIFKTTSG